MFLSKNNFYHCYKIKKTLIKSAKKIIFSMKGLSFLADMCYYNGEERIRRKELII